VRWEFLTFFERVKRKSHRRALMIVAGVVVQAPEYVIENLKLAEKSARNGKKTVKRRRRKGSLSTGTRTRLHA
jgi:hypothetical protein